ncbi:S49 family peptidase [Halobellus clavatus]|uniref:Protease-4 n=1 Tax=Halobellus clavatus TaxID=660517 RepID=A0A1H3JAF4_9EURY|nr:S49 family peptidase [Halobellus clavatus]SDY36525.1 protease-4 [Halobellus clavatus]
MSRDSSVAQARTIFVVAIVAAVLVSAVLAPVAYDYGTSAQSDGTVSVITISGTISGTTVDGIAEDLRNARTNESIEAVVLKVDSGGGAVAPSERLYLEVLRTAEQMPVVASVQGVGASGAYYGMLPADEIYVLSSSQVGSVGVIGSGGSVPVPDSIIRTGPDKAQPTADQRERTIESLKRQFVGRVMEHRGENISLSREEVAYARTYLGPEAVENGYADGIGSLPAAIDHAAELAGMEDYDVVRQEPPNTLGLFLFATETDNGTQIYKQSDRTSGVVPVTRPLMVDEVPYHSPEVIANASA